ncbi:hypothetical protein BT93_E2315 [Corymbia citriodora subsp. variegata]|nr:hypothetical protein BT93_E2315 [Corymbia citriodora subsp. variegata]
MKRNILIGIDETFKYSIPGIHSITIPSLFIAGWLFASAGLAYDMFGSTRPNEYFIDSQQGIPLIVGRFDLYMNS